MKPLTAEGPVWLDGRWVPAGEATLDLTSTEAQAGLGVFETLAVRDGRVVDLGAHVDRLRLSAERLSVPLPEAAALQSAAREAAVRVAGGYGWIKISAMRSGRCAVWGGRMDPADEGRPVAVVLLPWRKNPKEAIAGVKTLNYANQILGLEFARRRDAEEGIWLNVRGHLAEGCTSNLFVVRHRRLFTPSVSDGILPGIVRSLVIRAASQLGITMHEGKIRLERLRKADEAFLTSSLRGVRPIAAFEGETLGRGEVPGPMTRKIAEVVRGLRVTS